MPKRVKEFHSIMPIAKVASVLKHDNMPHKHLTKTQQFKIKSLKAAEIIYLLLKFTGFRLKSNHNGYMEN